MATKSRKIPQSIWDRHKTTILGLYLTDDKSTAELVHTMENDHGFSATLSQFEAQLKVWKARKNLKRHEWENILETIDRLDSRGVKSRVVISGHPVPVNRIHRARRYGKGKRPSRRLQSDPHHVASSVDDNDALVEVEGLDGTWSPYRGTINEDASSSIQQQRSPNGSPVIFMQTILAEIDDGAVPMHLDNVDGYLDGQELLGAINFSPRYSTLPTPNFMSDTWIPFDGYGGAPHHMEQLTFSSQLQSSQMLLYHGQDVDLATSPLGSGDLVLYPSGAACLKGLPFERFEHELASRGISLTVPPSPVLESQLLPAVTTFLAAAVAAMTQANGKSFQQNFYAAGLTMQTLKSIFPGYTQGQSSNITRSSQEILEAELPRLLLFSVANGFVGMDDIPVEMVFRFIDDNSNIATLLSRFFLENYGPVAKSIAENLFRAAIESGDERAIRFFLQAGLVSANSTYFFVEGEKITPLGRAAKLQKLKVVRELLKCKPDVNRTFLKAPPSEYWDDYRGPLGGLIGGICPPGPDKNHDTFPPEYLGTVDALIDAGAWVRASFVRMTLRGFVRMDLAKKLVCKLAPVDHSEFISDEQILGHIATEFSDEDATEAITKIISDCEQTGCGQCLSRYEDHVNWTVVVGAKQGHIQLVQALYRYAQSPAQILAAAIRGGSHELVQFILAQKPDLHSPAQDIDTPPWHYKWTYTTPLAEALRAGDEVLTTLRNEGALENFENDKPHDIRLSRFACALSAAAEVGDIEYVRRLLLLKPQAYDIELGFALLASIENNQEEVTQLLLDAGAETLQGHEGREMSPMITAYEWGNMPLLNDILSTCPILSFSHAELTKLVENVDMLDFFYRSGRLSEANLDTCLLDAVEREDLEVLRHLLELGVDPMAEDGKAIEFASGGHLEMLQMLVEYVSPTRFIGPRVSEAAVIRAIEHDQNKIEVLEMLLACRAIRHKFLGSSGGESNLPLAAAIRRDSGNCRYDFPWTKRLLDAGWNIDGIVNDSKETPLVVAIETRREALVEFLIDRGADVNKEATIGIRKTPLQAAAETGCLNIVELLLRNGAEINAKPALRGGGTALQYAAMGGNCNIAATLLDRGAVLNGRWPLEGAAEHGRLA
ncbi:ankyrin [Hypoxylon sp. NC1633]|nr:ankyrin [Hypoxylon sp. NC1633]